MPKCSFSGEQVPTGAGIMYVLTDGKILWFKNSKCMKNYLNLKRKPLETRWTKIYRDEHKKGTENKTENKTDIINASSDGIQKIIIGFKGNYEPNTLTVKAGKPVEIILDSSVRGCYRSFNIPDLGVSYYSSGPSDTIKFTPENKGKFRFACGMNMGYGSIIVV